MQCLGTKAETGGLITERWLKYLEDTECIFRGLMQNSKYITLQEVLFTSTHAPIVYL